MKKFRQEKLDEISTAPEADGSAWLRDAERSIEFLEEDKDRDEVVIYAITKCVLVHGVLGLSDKLTPDAVSDLQHQNIPMADDSWRIQYAWGGGMGHRIYLEPPMSSVSEALVGGEKLVFRRPFTGVDDGPAQIEISQKLVHSLDLHYVEERTAFCRLDDQGDIEEVIKIRQRDTDSTWDYLHVVTVLRSELDRFMAVSGTCLVLRFDFTRVRWGNFGGWGDIERYERTYDDLYYHGGVSSDGSYCNGVMVVRPAVSVEDLVEEWKAEKDGSSKQYATFKIYDRKNRKNVETSCSPVHISNYFQKTELPWEIYPAFFKPSVLLKYKADPDKYTLEDRTISCRNAWSLPTYDINEAGQVHTYIGYLANLPYQEQQYWQSFNEWSKGGISKRAFQTDIVGDWYTEYDPLSALKTAVSQLDAEPPDWWNKMG